IIVSFLCGLTQKKQGSSYSDDYEEREGIDHWQHIKALLDDCVNRTTQQYTRSSCRGSNLLLKKALRQCGDKRHFNNQADKRFECGNECLRFAWLKLKKGETPSMKRNHTNNKRIIPCQVSIKQMISQGKDANDKQIRTET